MARIDFYQLGRQPVEAVLPRIAEKLLNEGHRLLVVAEKDPVLDLLDRALWTWRAESFLPHGRAGGEDDAGQPVLLSATVAPVNGAANLALADGRWREEALGFERTFLLFGADTLDEARSAWKSLSGSAAERHFWRQDERGRWSEQG